eukprot:tig00000981_g5862.t1
MVHRRTPTLPGQHFQVYWRTNHGTRWFRRAELDTDDQAAEEETWLADVASALTSTAEADLATECAATDADLLWGDAAAELELEAADAADAWI